MIGAKLARWFSRRVGEARPERLQRTMRGPLRRRFLLGLIFRVMPRAVRRRALEQERAVIEWRITGRADGRPDVRQLVLDGEAAVVPGTPQEPDLTFTMDGVDFLLLATGNASGPTLFVRGQIEMDGDPWLAMRLPRLFAAGSRRR